MRDHDSKRIADTLGDTLKFTDRYLRSLQPRESAYDVREGDGFVVRVFPSGKISFQFVYNFCGRLRRLTLGPYPAMSLADARALHRKALDARALGNDPAACKGREVVTVEDLANDYLEKWAKAKKRSWKQDKRILNVDVLPTLGRLRAADVTRRQVLSMLEKIEARAPNQAWQVLKITRRMFNFALEQSLAGIEFNPCAHIKLSAPRVKKDRCLNDTEIKTFWHGIETLGTSEAMRRALKAVLVTGQRPGEVLGAHRGEIEGEWWTIPEERAKNGRAHRVYLTATARALFGDGDGYLFGNMATSTAGTAVRRMLVRKDGKALPISPFTPHDLRRTAATNLGEIGYSNHLIGKILNHTDQGVTAIYNRYEYDREKREMLEAWEGKLKQMIDE